ncbi:MAG: FkbM family methyltransferase [Promethearchaeota archaeon]|nr:MAG: FkbM family methyltransferase [Candidatus Lokiarchaeota archaeon]
MKTATLLYKRILASHKQSGKLWNLCRKIFIKLFHDPSCTLNIHEKHLQLPLSHQLPINLKCHPFYDRLLDRLSDFIRTKYSHLKCIDVGANIGDSIAACLKHDTDIFLAIEPHPTFNKYLHKNFGKCSNVKIMDVVCSSSSKTETYQIDEKSGTASVISSRSGRVMQTKTIDKIIEENIEFSDANFLKIDTDGHDFRVIAGAKKFITENLPVILFECDFFGNNTYIENCMETLNFFKEVGYSSFLIYDNFGYLMGKQSLEHLLNFKHLLFYQLTSKFYYFDLLLMKEEEMRIFIELEHSYFISKMSNKALQRAAKVSAEL